jgi:hypothetical protein
MTAFQNINLGAGYGPWPEAIHDFANDGRATEKGPPTAISVKVQRLLSIEPEKRLLSLLRPRGPFTEDDIRNAESAVADFIDAAANREILNLAGQFIDEGIHPYNIPDAWLTEQRKSSFHQVLTARQIPDTEVIFAYACIEQRKSSFHQVLTARQIPDTEVIFAYACIELFKVAMANYRIQERRRRTKPDFNKYQPTGDELAAEAEFASMLNHE